jgi:hypothetical protein
VKSFTESLPPSSNADDTLAANTEYLNSRHGKHRLMHLEEEGKVKKVESGSQSGNGTTICYKMSASFMGRRRAFSRQAGFMHHNLDSRLSKEDAHVNCISCIRKRAVGYSASRQTQ